MRKPIDKQGLRCCICGVVFIALCLSVNWEAGIESGKGEKTASKYEIKVLLKCRVW